MNWKPWIRGLISNAVAGLGTALAGLAADIAWPKLKILLILQALIHVGLFLQKSPIPEDRQVWTPEQRAAKAEAKP